ncbi:uncharacterized protein DUF998 [Gelidibacter algens]|jgi:hypothetical protein|uniref:Uncharacterized protein DUF998 n=1 Tax=Gelidibacter algens TaxID=49280 RepID=A0A1A7R3H9_9FLAO|nr:DUF998 domain-containing protein [Gelidibacter algens]OBX26019.1 hypothetical protein A9996_06815 [Gelidibacter algens]RAJ27714.1 uncharacterized protein DUF998 [Gelidibacter algens]
MKYKHEVLKYGGIALVIGSLSTIVADVVGIMVVEDHNPVRQTISQLAHGKYAYIQDIGLTVFGIGILLGGMALYVWRSNSTMLKLGAFLLGIMGICIVVLAEFNQFAGTPGTTIHIVLSVVIGLLYLSSTILIGIAFKKINTNWYYGSIGIGISFLMACSGFLIISEAYEGAYERGVVLIVLIWFCAMAYQMMTHQHESNPSK